MNSRTLDFAEEVKLATGGEGVDVVLNSLNGEFIPKSLEILSKQGRFIEIGKIGIWNHDQVQDQRADIAYFPFDLLEISTQNPDLIASMLTELMEEFAQNSLKPLPHTIFPLDQVIDAFRYMEGAKHIGKVVISWPENTSSDTDTHNDLIQAANTYLITGGLGALGRKVAHWLIQEQGARHLVLTSRRPPASQAQEEIKQLEQTGAKILVLQADVSQPDDLVKMLNIVASNMPPLKGIIHAAGILDDGMLLGQNWERFRQVMSPKVAGTWNLHNLTQKLPLDFFVCFSSVASLLGSPGQSSYAAANAFMDAIAYHRHALGLPCTSINWGPWSDAGMAANLGSRQQNKLTTRGMTTIAPVKGLQALEELLRQEVIQMGVLPINWSQFWEQLPSGVRPSFLDEFRPISEQYSSQNSGFLQQLSAAPISERKIILINHVRAQIAKGLGLAVPEQIGLQDNFSDLGMDSLMAVELSNRLKNSLGCHVSSTLTFDYPTLEDLVNYLANDLLTLEFSHSDRESSPQNAVEQVTDHSSPLEDISDSEAEALLISKLDSMRY